MWYLVPLTKYLCHFQCSTSYLEDQMSVSSVAVNRAEIQINKNMKDKKSSERIESASCKYGECRTYVDKGHPASKSREYDLSQDKENRLSERQNDTSGDEISESCDHGDQKSFANVEYGSSNNKESTGDQSGSSIDLSNLMSTKVPPKTTKPTKVLKRIRKLFLQFKTVFGCHCQPYNKED